MVEPGIVIIGASHAGVTLAGTLRQKKASAPITLIGAEAVLPYHRPPLSKKLLTGEMTPQAIGLRAPNFYTDHAINLQLGTRVIAIDRTQQRLTLCDGETLSYGALVLATGARARPLPVSGRDLDGVHTLRTLADAQGLGSQLVPGARLVIVGAGYIGLEVAACARQLGTDVTVVERANAPLARVASPVVAEWARARHESRGVRFRFDANVVQLDGGPDGVEGVQLDDGSVLPADIVLVGIGAEPDTDLAAAAALELDNGVAVDDSLRSSDPNIYAIGDISSFPCKFSGQRRRLESIQNAQEQARALATTLAGEQAAPYRALPWFWSDQGPDKLQSAGTSHPSAEWRLEGNPHANQFTVRHVLRDRLIATESVNDPKTHMKTRREIEALPAEMAI